MKLQLFSTLFFHIVLFLNDKPANQGDHRSTCDKDQNYDSCGIVIAHAACVQRNDCDCKRDVGNNSCEERH